MKKKTKIINNNKQTRITTTGRVQSEEEDEMELGLFHMNEEKWDLGGNDRRKNDQGFLSKKKM